MDKYDESQIVSLLSEPKTRRRAFDSMVRRYSEQIYWQIRRIVLSHDDTDDIMQNVFMKAWLNIDTFRNDSKLSTWLYRIALNESLDFIRKRKDIVSSDASDPSVAGALLSDRYFDGDEAQAMLQEAISKLPPVQRNVFNMRYYDEMKYSEMSSILKTSEGALKASYHIAVKKISDYFKERD